jgi:S-adenosylhomocysteine hydrolase/quercetin dioxygenase-like cupin family protein
MNLILEALASYGLPAKIPKRVVVCTHAKFSALGLCQALQSAGVSVTFHPVTYSKEAEHIDQVLAMGVQVVEQPKTLIPYIEKADCIIEDGARLSKIISEHDVQLKKGFYSVEQTSGGIRHFEEHPPAYPVINVALSAMKLDIENRRATPEGVIRYFSEATGKLLGGKRVFVVGFGTIGEGIASLVRTLGAQVTIYDTFATRRLFARHHGYMTAEKETFDHVLPMQDIIFMATNTYQGMAFGPEQLLLLPDGAIICNAGSGRGELAPSLHTPGTYRVHDADMEIREEGDHLTISFTKYDTRKTITVLGKAFPLNLHIGKGTSHDAIEIVMTLLLLGALSGPPSKKPGVYPLSFAIQEHVAETVLRHNQPAKTFAPAYVKTHDVGSISKPYGGIYPFHNELSDIVNLSVARAWFKGGSKTRGHYHRRSQEAFYVEKGQANIILWPAGEAHTKTTYAMVPGDYLLIPENYFHDVQVTSGDDFECLVIATPPFMMWDQFFKTEEKTR